MKFVKLSDEQIYQAAKQTFPDSYIKIEYTDIYLRDTKSGRYRADWIDQEFYVSTDYAYEDILVKENKTRYKIAIPCILVKKDQYQVVYSSRDVFYAVFMINDQIQFKKYVDVIEEIRDCVELIEEIQSV